MPLLVRGENLLPRCEWRGSGWRVGLENRAHHRAENFPEGTAARRDRPGLVLASVLLADELRRSRTSRMLGCVRVAGRLHRAQVDVADRDA